MRGQVTEHTVLVATHTIWEDVTIYLGDPSPLSQCFCLCSGYQHPWWTTVTWRGLLWQWGPDGLHTLMDLFDCGNQSDWVFCYTEGTVFFLIENSVICRVSDASYMALCSVRTPQPQYWGCTQYCAFLGDTVKTCRNVISYTLLPFIVSQCTTLCFCLHTPSSRFALFSTVCSTQRKVSH